jgi:HEAT repeat protein
MFRALLNAFKSRAISQRNVSRLLERLASRNPATSKDAEKSLEAIFYPDVFAGRQRILTWGQYSFSVENHHSQIRRSPVVIPLLSALVGTNHSARLFAIRALAANQEPRALNHIVAALADESSEIRAEAARSLMHYRDPHTVGPLITALSDKQELPRQSAANTLGFLRDPRAASPLLQLIESQHWRDRQCALYALGDICDEASLPIIRRHLRDSQTG